MSVIDEIAAERRRQVEVEGWTHVHDDQEHQQGELASAAACYAGHVGAIQSGLARRSDGPPANWPWDGEYWRPKTHRRDLIRAAALIVAEIERLDRCTT